MSASRRLIVNADDFGRSRSINEAVIRAHEEGILTSADLGATWAAGGRPGEPYGDDVLALAYTFTPEPVCFVSLRNSGVWKLLVQK